jgi:hypothetical protein
MSDLKEKAQLFSLALGWMNGVLSDDEAAQWARDEFARNRWYRAWGRRLRDLLIDALGPDPEPPLE